MTKGCLRQEAFRWVLVYKGRPQFSGKARLELCPVALWWATTFSLQLWGTPTRTFSFPLWSSRSSAGTHVWDSELRRAFWEPALCLPPRKNNTASPKTNFLFWFNPPTAKNIKSSTQSFTVSAMGFYEQQIWMIWSIHMKMSIIGVHAILTQTFALQYCCLVHAPQNHPHSLCFPGIRIKKYYYLIVTALEYFMSQLLCLAVLRVGWVTKKKENHITARCDLRRRE